MKKLILFTLTLFVTNVTTQAQTHNELIKQYAEDHMEQKVGNGVCRTLISEAYKYAGLDDPFSRRNMKKGMCYCVLGRVIPKDSAITGDIVHFAYYDNVKKKPLNGHIGIVYGVSENNMSVINQNYNVSKTKYSIVTVAVWNDITEVDSTITQKITFYRPK